jgi:YesN/AraC family two-component response regulator
MTWIGANILDTHIPTLFLVDLRENKEVPPVCSKLSNRYKVYLLHELDILYEQIDSKNPHLICFDFDYPDTRSLSVLEKTKYNYPSIPVIMVTQYHDEQLAIWALRARVWDYFIQPVPPEEIFRSIRFLSRLKNHTQRDICPRNIVQSMQINAVKTRKIYNKTTKDNSFNVIKYIENHYHEKIYIAELAKKCKISIYQFSRVFKREKGITFRDYLVNYRLNKARELLQESALSVGDVGFEVGFSDPSYFTRVFRRHMGVSPSGFRLRKN